MPIEIKGNWKTGFALELHTIGSKYLGKDESGHKRFETTRTKLGELVFKLKYQLDFSVVPQIINYIIEKIKISEIDYIIPVLPSKQREKQPIFIIAEELSKKTGIKFLQNSIEKIKSTEEIKNIDDFYEKVELLKNCFQFSGIVDIKDKNILVIDDLFQTGATLNAISKLLYNEGKVKNVFVLTLTKTRRKK